MRNYKGKTLHGWQDLKDYGIIILTGEADPYSLRGLFDITEAGKALIEEFFGCPVGSFNLPGNWNSGAVASIMLPYGVFQELAIYILFHREHLARVAFQPGGSWPIQGYTILDGEYFDYEQWLIEGTKVLTNPGKYENRNEHAFSGRTY